MPRSPEIRPATDQETENIHWWPAHRIAKRKENPILSQVLEILRDNPVAVIDMVDTRQGGEYVIARKLRDKARQSGETLNISVSYRTSEKPAQLFVRHDPNPRPRR